MSWSDLTDWWLAELSEDEAYERVVTPLLLEILRPEKHAKYVELGCGEGRIMRALQARGSDCFGVDGSFELARLAGRRTAVATVSQIPLRSNVADGTLVVLVLEHIEDHGSVFEEAARITRPCGVLALVANHPIWTAPGSTPITDSDGEVLWRSGSYFSDNASMITAGGSTLMFYHRTVSALFTSAASAGWALEEVIERPHHYLGNQSGIPRLIGCRWRLAGNRVKEAEY